MFKPSSNANEDCYKAILEKCMADPDQPECFDRTTGEVCQECIECSHWCDVCGFWYSPDEPCEFH